ncbi:UV-endonuclease UvdE [Saitoella complicata NRRL Y-17804]|uniref:UV-endonuclease UvdE n=1 Tax=Saitoella complicata (strain BCRC 22490 / CBS 7301 / JCM 7358 / NBRC 10748 / NRRL Y-17804) TaxID=698492 RepID=UPI000866F716|nr:UV-endonuclease UvdE [Saitoella complicata NRRL Y-17804]ODQ52088.1 UV-endonuclease UvdE [Saitoella complicata NRRL Y-17804]
MAKASYGFLSKTGEVDDSGAVLSSEPVLEFVREALRMSMSLCGFNGSDMTSNGNGSYRLRVQPDLNDVVCDRCALRGSTAKEKAVLRQLLLTDHQEQPVVRSSSTGVTSIVTPPETPLAATIKTLQNNFEQSRKFHDVSLPKAPSIAPQKLKGKENEITEAEGDREASPDEEKIVEKVEDEMEEDANSIAAEEGVPLSKAKQKAKEKRDEAVKEALARPAPVDKDYVPIPWKGRLGYACLNTILRELPTPIFCSRTCRQATLEKEGMEFVRALGKQNAADLSKMIEWNERFGIRFLRVSSEMFPFASHEKFGYTLEFADEELTAAGALAMKYGHRLTTHPGQFTQIASPREQVVDNAFRDLIMHDELLTRLGMTGQADRDAVMIIHLGGTYGDKPATLDRFRANYARLPESVKRRLVLENDDVCWSVTDLLPLCKELGVPLVLDWHHHNIVHGDIREGSLDPYNLLPEINALWEAKGITPKQHYSESRPGAIMPMERRGHSKRVRNLPPCPDTTDLMIEAKDKEQAVFELARVLNLDNPKCPPQIAERPMDEFHEGGWKVKEPELDDDGKPIPPKKKVARAKKGKAAEAAAEHTSMDENAMEEQEKKAAGENKDSAPSKKKRKTTKKAVVKEATPEETDDHESDSNDHVPPTTGSKRTSGRARKAVVSYQEAEPGMTTDEEHGV